jgi:hypothetical protein
MVRHGKSDPGKPASVGGIQDRINATREKSAEPLPPPPRGGDDEGEEYLRWMAESLKTPHLTTRGKKSTPVPPPSVPPMASPPPRRKGAGAKRGVYFEPGAILHLGGEALGILASDLPRGRGKELLLLQPDGTVLSKEGDLEKCMEIGTLPEKYLLQVLSEKRWTHDLIVYHLHRLRYHPLVPCLPNKQTLTPEAEPEPAEKPLAAATPSPKPSDLDRLRRGRHFRIIHSATREWDAIYWGDSEHGHAVAHESGGEWFLVPMDLDRYRDRIVALEMLDEAEQQTIANAICQFRP